MQGSLAAEATALPIQIFGVNGIGHESGNAEVCANRTTPWLQDTAQGNVWTSWSVAYRDVVVLDSLNQVVAIFNLTEHDLADSSSYDSLRTLLLETAGTR